MRRPRNCRQRCAICRRTRRRFFWLGVQQRLGDLCRPRPARSGGDRVSRRLGRGQKTVPQARRELVAQGRRRGSALTCRHRDRGRSRTRTGDAARRGDGAAGRGLWAGIDGLAYRPRSGGVSRRRPRLLLQLAHPWVAAAIARAFAQPRRSDRPVSPHFRLCLYDGVRHHRRGDCRRPPSSPPPCRDIRHPRRKHRRVSGRHALSRQRCRGAALGLCHVGRQRDRRFRTRQPAAFGRRTRALLRRISPVRGVFRHPAIGLAAKLAGLCRLFRGDGRLGQIAVSPAARPLPPSLFAGAGTWLRSPRWYQCTDREHLARAAAR